MRSISGASSSRCGAWCNGLEMLANVSGSSGSLSAEVYELRENPSSGHRVYTFRETDKYLVL